MTSVPCKAAGMECCCTGVGLVYEQRSMFATSSCGKLNASQTSWKDPQG
eukprot:CAMPEP_0180682600 /NCGR_PEP_ID=MMETSP1037_2-20121125/70649_1 /TAXON_ID=632150 /ORGANISM="Azadinium spinosum, Strain 3D9" /LENGTH=48 /DNA_ID= /DNA_START= /DNA_END= /DNA_ORIENTATION=